jgi:hypothetical protein
MVRMKERFRLLRAGFRNTLSFLGDIVILNLLFLICSIPIVTIGASASACYAGVCRNAPKKRNGACISAQLSRFSRGIRQSTAGWLLELLVISNQAGESGLRLSNSSG